MTTTKMSPARPTTYNGIKMRSRLEAGYAAWLDSQGFQWHYEPECFASAAGQYLPDFVIHDVFVGWLGRPAEVYVEVKPTPFLWFEDGMSDDDYDNWGKERSRLTRLVDATLLRQRPDAVFIFQAPEPVDQAGYRTNDHSLTFGYFPGAVAVIHYSEILDWIEENVAWCRGPQQPMLALPNSFVPWPRYWWKRK